MTTNRYVKGDLIWYVSTVPHLQVVEGEIIDIHNNQYYVIKSKQTRLRNGKPKFFEESQVYPDKESALVAAKNKITITPYKA